MGARVAESDIIVASFRRRATEELGVSLMSRIVGHALTRNEASFERINLISAAVERSATAFETSTIMRTVTCNRHVARLEITRHVERLEDA